MDAIKTEDRPAASLDPLSNPAAQEVSATSTPTPELQRQKLLSVVVPAYNEQEVLGEFHRRLSSVLDTLPELRAEVLYVNDGSSDETCAVVQGLIGLDERVGLVDLSRNFGKEIALSAGLDHAKGDYVVVIDADLQDPPELIPELLEKAQSGFDVVYARRRRRQGETAVKKFTAFLFYRLMNSFGGLQIPQDTGDFRLLTRRAIDALLKVREKHRFMKGLFTWIGFAQTEVLYQRDPRHAGTTKWNYWRLWNFALEGFTSFTIGPLKVATYVGLLAGFGAMFYAAFVVFKTLYMGEPVRGYASLMVVILSVSSIQLISLGIMGEYLGRVFNETKNRPLYLLRGYQPPKPEVDPK